MKVESCGVGEGTPRLSLVSVSKQKLLFSPLMGRPGRIHEQIWSKFGNRTPSDICTSQGSYIVLTSTVFFTILKMKIQYFTMLSVTSIHNYILNHKLIGKRVIFLPHNGERFKGVKTRSSWQPSLCAVWPGGSQMGVQHVKEGESVGGARQERQEAKHSFPRGRKKSPQKAGWYTTDAMNLGNWVIWTLL